jgi:hypothetical protein
MTPSCPNIHPAVVFDYSNNVSHSHDHSTVGYSSTLYDVFSDDFLSSRLET